MKIRTVRDPELTGAVHGGLRGSQYSQYVSHALNLLEGRTVYLWGGAVRDYIAHHKYGVNGDVKDFDLLVDDSEEPMDKEAVFQGHTNWDGSPVTPNRFGTPKWRPKAGMEIDVSCFTNANPIRMGLLCREARPDLELLLTTCGLTTGSICYDFHDGAIYDYMALDGIERKEVELMFEADRPHVNMARMVLHANKLGFTIGPRGLGFIREGYAPALDHDIREYLLYKQKGEEFDCVISTLRGIAAQG